MELGWVSNLDVYVWWCRTDLDGWMSMTWCSMHPTSDGDVHMHFVSFCMARSLSMRRASPPARRGGRGMMHMREKKPLQCLVLKKLRKLKKIVPGCRDVGLEALLRRTADYISFLELKVIVLKRIFDIHDSLVVNIIDADEEEKPMTSYWIF
ncbi:unnamed protein product [Musa acuminata subsp. burmannicoides]